MNTRLRSNASFRRNTLANRFVLSIIVWAAAILIIMPFIWMVSSSFKDNVDMFRYPIQWIPKHPTDAGYRDVWASDIPFLQFYMNSIKVSAIAITGTFLSCSLAGFAYAKLRFPGRDALFLLKVSSAMIPFQVMMLPTFLIYRALGLVDTHAALWLQTFFGMTFGTFLMRQFYLGVPDELIDAAKIDGASYVRIYAQIMLPLASSALATLMFLYFTWTWNDYEKPLLYLRSSGKFTLPLALKYFSDEFYTNYTAIMAAAVSTTIPIIIMYVFAQRYLVQGITSTGIKG
jgi:multiple sugar transport system permease protein